MESSVAQEMNVDAFLYEIVIQKSYEKNIIDASYNDQRFKSNNKFICRNHS